MLVKYGLLLSNPRSSPLEDKFQVSFYEVCVQIQKKDFGLFLWLIKLPDSSLLLLSQGWF